MIVQDDGTMTVTLDGRPYLPEPFAPAWRRESFPHVIDQITDHRARWVRITVVEADGHLYTDNIAPQRRTTPDETSRPEPAEITPAASAAPSTVLVQMSGQGFEPGEDTAVALVIAHASASPDGTVRALLDGRRLAASPTREVILLGRISGSLHIEQPT